MKIYINDEIQLFTLKTEKTLLDLIKMINIEVYKNNHYIQNITYNGEILLLDDISIYNSILIEDINELLFTTQTIMVKVENNLLNIKKDIQEIQFLINKEDLSSENKSHIIHSIQNICFYVDEISNLLYVPFSYVFFKNLFLKDLIDSLIMYKNLMNEKIRNNTEFLNLYSNGIESSLNILESIFLPNMLEIYDLFYCNEEEYIKLSFKDIMKKFIKESRLMLQESKDISIYFQTGKDKEGIKALEKVVTIYEFISQLVLRCRLLDLIKGQQIDDLQNTIQEYIKNMEEALEQKDIISLCDIIEYDYIPILENLTSELISVVDPLGL